VINGSDKSGTKLMGWGRDAFAAAGKKHIVLIIAHLAGVMMNVFSLMTKPIPMEYYFRRLITLTVLKQVIKIGNIMAMCIWGGKHLSAHHNLFAHCNNRNPRFNGNRQGIRNLLIILTMCTIGAEIIFMREKDAYNIVNNYFKYGPSTNKNVRYRIVNPGKTETIGFGKWYVSGNFVDEAKDVSQNNWLGIHMGNGGTEEDKKNAVIDKPHVADPMKIQTAEAAFDAVLKSAGASFKRDTLDERIINDVRNRTGFIIDVQGRYPNHSPFEMTLNAWPALRSLPALADNDKDGIPDEWERKNGLNPQMHLMPQKFRLIIATNIELHFNSIVK
jgi:hypothetical protein